MNIKDYFYIQISKNLFYDFQKKHTVKISRKFVLSLFFWNYLIY
jgi:hypothetical protein